MLARLVGFGGDSQRVSASAVAIRALAPRDYCVVALASSGEPTALRTNGLPKTDLTGCSVISNTDATCNGHDLKATYGDAVGTNNGCGRRRSSNVEPIEDQYEHLASNIPSNPCRSNDYSWIPDKKNDPDLAGGNQLLGFETRTEISICGDTQLQGPVVLNGGDTQIVIYGGSLDLQNFTLETRPGSTVTIIFTGPHFSGRDHVPMVNNGGPGIGTLDIQAPTSGDWKGIAIYQDPSLMSGVDIDAAGNRPTWDITGVVYLPHAGVTLSGAVNKSSSGASCFVLVADSVLINGTGSIMSRGECDKAGVDMPSSPVPSRGQLVS